MITHARPSSGRNGLLHAPVTLTTAGIMRRTAADAKIGRSVTAALMGDPPPNRSMLKARDDTQLEAACEQAGISLALLRRSSFMVHGDARRQIVATLKKWGWQVSDIASALDYDPNTVWSILYHGERGAHV